MLYAQTISAMEQFLSSYFIGHIKDDVNNLLVEITSFIEKIADIRIDF